MDTHLYLPSILINKIIGELSYVKGGVDAVFAEVINAANSDVVKAFVQVFLSCFHTPKFRSNTSIYDFVLFNLCRQVVMWALKGIHYQ